MPLGRAGCRTHVDGRQRAVEEGPCGDGANSNPRVCAHESPQHVLSVRRKKHMRRAEHIIIKQPICTRSMLGGAHYTQSNILEGWRAARRTWEFL